ncbi:MAG: hypothetical protein ACE366_20460 [Bradymonadia bacterium]
MGWRVTWLTLIVLGCEPSEVTGLYPDRDAVPATDALVLTQDGGVATGEALTAPDGVWLLYMHDRSCLSALNNSVEQIISTTYRVEISTLGIGGQPDERLLRQRLQMCKQDVSPAVGGLRTTIPPAIPASRPVQTLDAILRLDPDEGPSAYTTTELMDIWGLPAETTFDEVLPDSADDPRVQDQDGDGQPGVTVVVGNDLCEIYIVQRTRQRLSGASVSPIRIEGTFWSVVEQNVLAATNRLCESENVQTIGPNPYPFTLLRVDGGQGSLDLDLDGDGDITCDELITAEQALIDGDTLTAITPEEGVCDGL